ncbi:probable gluconokinase isoform X4 [Perognathus longimembris pacificus]|uniref:probable gluconokinase isoform X4 n=1 Tax=Perognathus longimembris pacificus TaxID=214514 RepID=UPI0020191516|nr:probable gluconokinase isoform X4 [Perognathus longimembris pacificus]
MGVPLDPAMAAPCALLVMGVSGSGKSTVGALLASELGWKFYDADDYHPEENRKKMGKEIPLTDQRCVVGTPCGSSLFSPEENVQRHPNTREGEHSSEMCRIGKGRRAS